MYLTYSEYTTYGGTIDEPTFNQLNFKCQKALDNMTAERVKYMSAVPDSVKRCLFELINMEYLFLVNLNSLVAGGQTGTGANQLASFSTDGYQETYTTGSGTTGDYMKSMRSSLNDTEKTLISDFLDYERDDNGVKLLYRGVYTG